MRLDRFLKVTQIIKRRSVAKETAEEGIIRLNGRGAKPSADVKAGDIIEIDMWNCYKKIQVLALPTANSIAKSKTEEYAVVKEYRVK